MSDLLPVAEVERALQDLPGWSLRGNAIEREWRFPDFAAAMRFVNAVAAAAEAANHHPDFAIHYNVVTLTLFSHDSGGVTRRDLRMAANLNGVVCD